MVLFIIGLIGGVAVLAALVMCGIDGVRHGDLPADARVSARVSGAGQPDEPRPVVVATVRNPSAAPVLAGLSVRRKRLPDLFTGGMTVTVPRRTGRRKFRAGSHATVGVVPAGASVQFTVPVRASARRYLMTAVVGQVGGRLRVYRLSVAGAQSGAMRTGRKVPTRGLPSASVTNLGSSQQTTEGTPHTS
jgi:hypothetical protein